MLFAQVLILATEEQADGGQLLLPETSELIAGVVAFAIIYAVMWKYAFPVLRKTLAARQEAIQGQLESAEGAKVEAESLLQDYREQVANARTEANRIIEEARQSGEAVKSEIVAKAEEEAAAIKARAHDEIVSERERAEADIRREVASLSLDVAEKVVGQSLDGDAQRALVDQFIDDLGGVSSS